jgi:predicted PurR-regulated permease PerM
MPLFKFNKYNNFYDNEENFKNNFLFVIFILLSILGFLFFLISTGLISNTLLVLFLSILVIYPYRKSAKILNSYFILFGFVFIWWILVNLGSLIIPFILALIIGYLLDPFVSKLEQIGVKRSISVLGIIVIVAGIIVSIAVFLFPQLIDQASNITKQVNIYVKNIKQFSTDKNTIATLKQFGLSKYTLKEAFDTELMPIVQDLSKKIFNSIFNLLLSVSNLAAQLINIILLPILTFYFLKDFAKIKNKLKNMIKNENETLYKYLNKFNSVMRIYIGWQITQSLIVAIVGSIVLTLFNIPYGILIACIAGLLNPIPYFGTIITLCISALISLLVNDGNFISNFVVISAVFIVIHLINAYLLEPNIAGNKIGLHPILMILSVFIFNSIFGILGMLVAVPITAVIVTFIKDMFEYYQLSKAKKYKY